MLMNDHILDLLWMMPIYGLLFKIGVHDHRTCRIPNLDIGLFVCYASIYRMFFGEIHILSALCLLGIGMILPALTAIFLKRSQVLGMGDVKLMSVCALFIPLDDLGGFLCCSGIFGIVYYAIFRKNPMPFAPAMGGAFVLMNFWKIWKMSRFLYPGG